MQPIPGQTPEWVGTGSHFSCEWKATARMRTIADIVPEYDQVQSLHAEELGAILLELWEDASQREDMATIGDFTYHLYAPHGSSSYPSSRKAELERIIAEAFSWLEREGLIVRDPHQPASFYRRTRRGRKIKTRVDVEAYRKAAALPRELLHPVIDEKTRSLFLRGDYDVAVFQAFKSIEVAVRDACGYEDDVFGPNLMRAAFHPDKGPLTDKTVVYAEREALSAFFAGAIGHAKNPQSHREKPVRVDEAAQLLMLASYLMSIVDARQMLR